MTDLVSRGAPRAFGEDGERAFSEEGEKAVPRVGLVVDEPMLALDGLDDALLGRDRFPEKLGLDLFLGSLAELIRRACWSGCG